MTTVNSEAKPIQKQALVVLNANLSPYPPRELPSRDMRMEANTVTDQYEIAFTEVDTPNRNPQLTYFVNTDGLDHELVNAQPLTSTEQAANNTAEKNGKPLPHVDPVGAARDKQWATYKFCGLVGTPGRTRQQGKDLGMLQNTLHSGGTSSTYNTGKLSIRTNDDVYWVMDRRQLNKRLQRKKDAPYRGGKVPPALLPLRRGNKTATEYLKYRQKLKSAGVLIGKAIDRAEPGQLLNLQLYQ
jgi:hypothetical protein